MELVPIMMYHGIYNMRDCDTKYTGGNVDRDGWQRTAESLKRDLEKYYSLGYRAIRLDDFLNGIIDVPKGLSPVILTFDDGIRNAVINGFDENGEPVFSEGCAIDVLEKFKAAHPDFCTTATFFLTENLFYQWGNNEAVMRWVLDHQYDIGNHTRNHRYLPNCSEREIEEEVGYMYSLFDRIIPGRYVNIVALPYGGPKQMESDGKYKRIMSGVFQGAPYITKAALLCGWEGSLLPSAEGFDRTRVKRIHAYDNNGMDNDIQMNLDALENGRKYISDGTLCRKTERE